MTSAMVQAATIEAALRLFIEPGQVTELRALDVSTSTYRAPHTESGYFDDVAKMAAAAASIRQAKGIYFTPNPINTALLARAANRIRVAGKGDALTGDSDVLVRRRLLIDVDPVRPAGISSTDAEHDAALAKVREIRDALRAEGWPDPILGDSGNGAHANYLIDVPVDDGGLVQQCLNALAFRFDNETNSVDQTVFNPARIWKLYGTLACKGDSTEARPHRVARIIEVPSTPMPVPTAMLEALAGSVPQAESESRPNHHNSQASPRGNHSFDIDEWIARHGLQVVGPTNWKTGRKWVFDTCPWNPAHTNGSAYILQLANGAIAAGCHHNGCKDNRWHELRDVIEPGWRERKGDDVDSSRLTGDVSEADESVDPMETESPGAAIEVFRPFPTAMLPEPVRGFVNVSAIAIGCDPTFIAVPLLSALAAAIGNARRIQLKASWDEPAIIWSVIVGDSGTHKSPAQEVALRALNRRQARAMREHKRALEVYRDELLRYERNLTRWKRGREEGRPPAKPQEPIAERILCDDTTVEALAVLLGAQPRGLLMTRDELSAWLASFNCYRQGRGGDEAKWLEMHGGRSILVDRKGHAPLHVPRAAVSIAGGIQPETLRRALTQQYRDNGLAARLLLAWPAKRAKEWTEAVIDRPIEEAIERVFERLFELQPTTDDQGEIRPRNVLLSPEAKRAWVEFFNAHAQEQADLTGELAAAWSKLEAYAARLALVIHLVRWAANDSRLSSVDKVDRDSLVAGVALARWFGREARRVYGMLNESDEARSRRLLVELIQRKGGSATPRELMRSSRLFKTAEAAEQALERLAKVGRGRWEDAGSGPTGGRPTRRFTLTVDADRTPETTEESEGSVNTRSEPPSE